jgi:hypothetical protein
VDSGLDRGRGSTAALIEGWIPAAAEPVRWDMRLTIGKPGDPEDDPTLAWPKERKEMKVGTLTISSAMAQKGAGCESINYDPLSWATAAHRPMTRCCCSDRRPMGCLTASDWRAGSPAAQGAKALTPQIGSSGRRCAEPWSGPSQIQQIALDDPVRFPYSQVIPTSQFPANSQTPRAAREHWRRRGACQKRSTSKIRQFDFGDCGPSICPGASCALGRFY